MCLCVKCDALFRQATNCHFSLLVAQLTMAGLSLADFGTLLSEHNLKSKTLYAQVILPSRITQLAKGRDEAGNADSELDSLLALCLRTAADRKGKGRETSSTSTNNHQAHDVDSNSFETSAAKSRRQADEAELRRRIELRLIASRTILPAVAGSTGCKYM